MGGNGKEWTVLFVRQDGTQAHSFRHSRRSWVLMVFIGIVLCLTLGAALGVYWGRSTESARLADLEAEAAQLKEERARVVELSSRLETIEGSYRRLQRALSGGVARSERDVALPEPSGAPQPWPAGWESDDDLSRPSEWPLAERGFVTRVFGSQGADTDGSHSGIDIAVPVGSYVRAAGGGEVAEAGHDPVYGDYVRIAHGDGVSSLYGHNSWLFVETGDSVARFEVIALSGNTGQSTAPHLHFEIRSEGAAVDPLSFVPPGR
jgi:murein DD-endopeptidase MepM/ murein hydrolase activator NlpD